MKMTKVKIGSVMQKLQVIVHIENGVLSIKYKDK